MSMTGDAPSPVEPPLTRHATPGRWRAALLVPLAAAILAGWLMFRPLLHPGQDVQVLFASGNGVSAGDPVVFRGVQVGAVRSVDVAPDLSAVVVRARLRPLAVPLAVEGSRFWIVRPEVSVSGVRGIETLFGPRYVEVAPGPSGAAPARRFSGLDARPPAPSIPGELRLVLRTSRRGSLNPGSPVLYRDVVVGNVESLRLADDAAGVEVHARIEPRYTPLVRADSRFWHASGIGLDFGFFGGLTFRAESLESVLAGGVAFATPTRPADPVADGHAFDLAPQPRSEWLEWKPAIPLGP